MSARFSLVLDANSYKQLALQDDASATFLQQQAELPNHQKKLHLSRHQAEAMLEALGDLLCTKDMTNDEINGYGLCLEPLIDLINEPLRR
ncbi:hypothetical protein [Hymenobacter arizonensis]|uniref:Uncharacterized protein n=1 Tax=Hymenobacter arizonensis TaxID=1227077 RepID=A0A1I6BMY1_HYMAR|nr:hypothetical protein [Hymenobacter arizonensis]SFQ82275.1 hypothetical protein SAMN04515668_4777 [Hymenobacter arizonensis]